MTTARRNLVTPSPVFYGLVFLTFMLGLGLWRGYEYNGVTLFLFVVSGWVLTLALHEFGHALVAYMGGDHSVVDKGYLTLDVRNYIDPMTSLAMPIFFLVLGGIGLPGGAVWINQGAIRSPKMRSLTSAAGPAANGLCGLLCLLPLKFGWIDFAEHGAFVLGLAFLGWIQIIAMIFNLVPIPGLDGFGIIEPHLSAETLRSVQPLRQYGIWIFIIAIWFIEPVRDAFFGFTDDITELIGGNDVSIFRFLGYREFQFWEAR